MDTTERNAIIQGLRELADFLTEHPTVPITAHGLNEFVETREEWDAVNRAATWLELHTDDFLVLRRRFAGGVRFDVNVERPAEAAADDAEAPTVNHV